MATGCLVSAYPNPEPDRRTDTMTGADRTAADAGFDESGNGRIASAGASPTKYFRNRIPLKPLHERNQESANRGWHGASQE
jgi:hypothetical protein